MSGLCQWYASALDRRTGQVCFLGEVEAGDLHVAGVEAERVAQMRAGHLEVEVTQIAKLGEGGAFGSVIRNVKPGFERRFQERERRHATNTPS